MTSRPWLAMFGIIVAGLLGVLAITSCGEGDASPPHAAAWQHRFSFPAQSSPAIVDGTVYVGESDNSVYALRAATCKIVWKRRTRYYVTSSPALAHGSVYVGSDDGRFYALNAATGRVRWTYNTQAENVSSPAVVG